MGKSLRGRELGKGICQRKDGYYIARFTNKFGNRMQKTLKTVKECKEWLAEQKYIDIHSDINKPSELLVDALYDMWIEQKRRSVRRQTCYYYENNYKNYIKEIIGNMKVVDVLPAHCQKVLYVWADKCFSNKTLDGIKSTMRNMFSYAIDNRVISQNPCNRSVKANIGKKPEEKIALSEREQALLIESISGHKYENQILLALQTGMRRSEITGLKWKDIDFNDGLISIERKINKEDNGEFIVNEPKSDKSRRKIPLTIESKRTLLRQLAKKRAESKRGKVFNEDYVFVDKNGEFVDPANYNNLLTFVCDSKGIRHISMHGLRHTFATMCAKNGMKPKVLQEIIGHEDIKTTLNIYVHTDEEEIKSEMSKVWKVV